MTNHTKKRSSQLVHSFEAKEKKKRSWSQKVADTLTGYFGSLGFLGLNAAVFTFWIVTNSGFNPFIPVFDPYPYVLLITVVSLEAILLTTIVLMSQKRQAQVGTLRDELQLQVQLITEREITKILELTYEELKKKGVKIDDAELKEMLQTVNTSFIEHKLEEQLGKK